MRNAETCGRCSEHEGSMRASVSIEFVSLLYLILGNLIVINFFPFFEVGNYVAGSDLTGESASSLTELPLCYNEETKTP